MSELSDQARNEWDQDNQCAYCFAYSPKSDGPVEQLVKRFKVPILRIVERKFVPDESPVDCAVEVLSSCLLKHYTQIFEDLNCKYLVPIPSHLQGYAAGNLAKAAARLATNFELKLLDKALARTQEIPSSRRSSMGQRPTHQMQFQSLSWTCSDSLDGGILLFDDVLTTGTTSQACKNVIIGNTSLRSENFVRLFLAKARSY